MHNFITSQKMPLHNFTHFCIPFELLKSQAGKTIFWGSHFCLGVTTIQVDFNHPGSPSLRLSPCHGMLLPRSPCQWFWRSNIQWISSHKLKPATPKATTIHPPTHPLPPLPLQRNASATPGLCVFFVEDFQALKGWREQTSFSKIEGNTCQGFFCSTDVSHLANVGWPISNFPISGRFFNIDIPITKRR